MFATQTICGAIEQRKILLFHYKGGLRRVEPHALGYHGDTLTLCAWQLSGGSGVEFRDFHVAKLTELATTDETFAGARKGYNRNDSTMDRILCRL